jgi:hypothetical protein
VVTVSICAAAAACIDFVEPDLAARGAAAVARFDIRIDDAGLSRVTGRLAPGVDEDGFLRELGRAAVRVADRDVAPSSTNDVGTRTYDDTVRIDAATRISGVRVEAPIVLDVDAPTPTVHWPALRRVGPDTVRVEADGSLVLRLAASGPLEPAPDVVQWSLRIEGDAGVAATITVDGLPPDPIRVPPDLMPPSTSGEWNARLALFLSVSLAPEPGDYIGLITLETRIEWVVVE